MDQVNQTNNPILGDALAEAIRQVIEAVNVGGSKEEKPPEDRLLTVNEAAQLLSLSPDWLYRHAKKLPFARKLGPKMLRFDYRGMLKWLETRKLSQ